MVWGGKELPDIPFTREQRRMINTTSDTPYCITAADMVPMDMQHVGNEVTLAAVTRSGGKALPASFLIKPGMINTARMLPRAPQPVVAQPVPAEDDSLKQLVKGFVAECLRDTFAPLFGGGLQPVAAHSAAPEEKFDPEEMEALRRRLDVHLASDAEVCKFVSHSPAEGFSLCNVNTPNERITVGEAWLDTWRGAYLRAEAVCSRQQLTCHAGAAAAAHCLGRTHCCCGGGVRARFQGGCSRQARPMRHALMARI